ncbi:MAG TPA: hypothetical protein VFH92_00405 [Phenylobacterium sp.]|nr:hypothetical protein [Phenylobacterium sp.]
MSGERAERLRPYFELQLRLARRLSELTGTPLGDIVLRHTNIHRRLGLGVCGQNDDPAPGWAPYAERLEVERDLTAQVAWTVEAFRAAPDEVLPHPGQFGFGCFAHEPPGEDGSVRIHFNNLDTDDAGGPLARAKIGRRTAELAALFAHVAETSPPRTIIRGGSWLYHVEAYRRLFPPAYVASRGPWPGPIGLRGTSTWGQTIDSRERIRPEIRDFVVANLTRLDPEAPWRAFPFQVLAVEAPLSVFLEFYGLGA